MTTLPSSDDLGPRPQPGLGSVLARTAMWILPAYALLFLPFLVDRLDPATEPWVDLTGTVALVAWLFAESGQTLGIIPIATVLIVVMVTRPGRSQRARLVEAAVVIAVSVLTLYGGKLVNDHVVKPAYPAIRSQIDHDVVHANPANDRVASASYCYPAATGKKPAVAITVPDGHRSNVGFPRRSPG